MELSAPPPVVNPPFPLLPVSWEHCSSPDTCPATLSPQHFVCAKCEKPFLGHRHYEKKGLAYCETHYNQVGSRSLRGWAGAAVRAREAAGSARGPGEGLGPGLVPA